MSNGMIGNLLYKLREKKNITQDEIASIMNVSRAAVSKWEDGVYIKTEYLYRLARFYNITVQELFEGKLNDESEKEHWKRNYDLDDCYFIEPISSHNLNKLKMLFERAKMVKERFFELLPLWANDNLDNLDEFIYLKQYFKFDYDFFYYEDIRDEKELIRKYLLKFKENKKEEIDWEIRKLYALNYDLKVEEIFNCGLIKAAVEYLFRYFEQVEKDLFLSQYIKDLKDIEMEDDENIKVMLKSKSRCLYDTICNYNPSNLDFKEFNFLEGEVIEQEDKNSTIEKTIKSGNKFIYWKNYSLSEYNKTIDHEKTFHLENMINNKNDNPLLYYQNLKKGGVL